MPLIEAAGAAIAADAAAVFAEAEMIVKVKEPQPVEIARLRAGQVLFTYLHLAADRAQAEGLLAAGVTAIAYETVTDARGSLPLLAPMSEVAGRMAVQVGAHCLEREQGGSGILLGGVPGVPPAKVVVLGGGVAGTNAARMAVGLEASVTIIDKSLPRLDGARPAIRPARHDVVRHHRSDRTGGAGGRPRDRRGAGAGRGGAEARYPRRRRGAMRPGSVLVDIAIDQGGCFETSRPTTHADRPSSTMGVVHYCVTNMPGAVARTSTFALTNATLPFVLALAEQGWRRALTADPHLRAGLNAHGGELVHPAVARALGLPCVPADSILRG